MIIIKFILQKYALNDVEWTSLLLVIVLFINEFVKVTTRGTELLKPSIKVAYDLSTCITLIKLSSVSFNPNIMCENKGS